MASDPVAHLRELDRHDAGLRERASRLEALDAAVAEVRTRAEEIGVFFAGYPGEDTRLRAAAGTAAREADRRRAEQAEARAAVEAARDEEARQLAERALARAADHVALAEAELARLRADHDELESEASALPAELAGLAERAREVAGELGDVPAPTADPGELVDWASRAHASIFVTSGGIDTQRDQVIREANELASLLLGEVTYGSTVAQARARVEALRP